MKRVVGVLVMVLSVAAIAACGAETPPMPVASGAPGVAVARPRPSPALEGAVRTCALVTSCAHTDDPEIFREPSSCAERLLMVSDQRSACLASARSCADVDACLERPHKSAEAVRLCAERRGVSEFCLGSAVVTCEGEPSITRCFPGESCKETTLASGLVVRGCAATCAAGAPPTRCARDGIVSCSPGMAAERIPCPSGSKCIEVRQAGGEVEAVCDRQPCIPGRGRCVGSLLESCVVDEDRHGSLVRADCAAAGLSCQSTGTSATCVAAAGCDRGPASCESGALRVCVAGASILVLCDRWGLGPCRVDEGGTASCAPSERGLR